MRTIALVFSFLLGITTLLGIVSAAEITPVYPGMGIPLDQLTGRHPTVKGNATIMEFFNECGVGYWYEEQMDIDYKSVHIPPANNCGKQLVFSMRMTGERNDPTRITDIWIIGANETWSSSIETVYPGGGISRVLVQPAQTRNVLSLNFAGAVIALAFIGIALTLKERKKKNS